MTRVQRRSKSQYHNRMKRLGYRWLRRSWWLVHRFRPITIALTGGGIGLWQVVYEEEVQ